MNSRMREFVNTLPPFLKGRLPDVLILGGILALALIFRLHNIDKEAPWYDELMILSHLDAPSYLTFLAGVRYSEVTASSFHPTISWLWIQWLSGGGEHVMGLRLLSILLGLGSIGVTYVMGKRLAGLTAGATAAALLAVSQTHIFYSQEIRPYALMLLLAALSGLALLQLIQRPEKLWPWLPINVLANGALLFTHMMSWTLLVVQGITLWLCRGKEIKLWVSWGVSQLPAVVFMYLFVIRRLDPHRLEQYRLPDLPIDRVRVLIMLREFAGVLAPEGAPGFFHAMFGEQLFGWMGVFLGVSGLLAIGGTVYYWRKHRQSRCELPCDPKGVVYLCVWAVLPAGLLFFLSISWWYMFLSRYIIHCTLAVALIAGCAVAMLSSRWLRTTVAGGLIAISATLTWLFPGPFRAPYPELFDTIQGEAAGGTVYVTPRHYLRTVEYNWPLVHGDVQAPAFVPVQSIEKVPLLLREQVESGEKGEVWVLYHMDFDPLGYVEAVLEEAGIRHEYLAPAEHYYMGAFLYRLGASL